MRRIRVYPYKQGSKSAKALATALGGKVLKREGSTYNQRDEDVVINWGAGDCGYSALNEDLGYVPNKLHFFDAFGEMAELPDHWQNAEEIPDDAYPVVCRTILNGHSGNGIVIANNADEIVYAPLYTKYIKKKDEYRVHVGWDSEALSVVVIAVQQKRKRNDVEVVNWQVRNHANGFVYCREDVNPPEAVTQAAKTVFEASGLCFGAVDVIWNEHEQRAYVLEINTAPGLEGQTVQDYANYFKEEMGL